MGIFFEPKPVAPEAEPELVEKATNAFAGPQFEWREADERATHNVEDLVTRHPYLAEPELKIPMTDLLAYAYRSPTMPPRQARRRAIRNVRQAAPSDPGQQQFQVGRFLAAVVIFAAVAGAALGADAAGLGDSTKALYGFAASIFGVIVGLLGGESSAKS